MHEGPSELGCDVLAVGRCLKSNRDVLVSVGGLGQWAWDGEVAVRLFSFCLFRCFDLCCVRLPCVGASTLRFSGLLSSG